MNIYNALNQWNAKPRPTQKQRGYGEIYIPIPSFIHKNCPDFFPPRDAYFNIKVPTGEVLKTKVCQDNSKALMTNPNKAISDWLLRKVLKLEERELLTTKKLDMLGFDSVMIKKEDDKFSIDIVKTNSYENFTINLMNKQKC